MRGLRLEKLKRLYRSDPVAYAVDVLKVEWTPKQVALALDIAKGGKVMGCASHGVGKTMLAGGIVNWQFDCWDPSITLTTAPTKAQVDDLTWKEVRVQRRGRPGLQPKSSRMETSEDHFAVGYTAAKPDSFQGRHEARIAAIFDEAVGIEAPFWEATEGMMTGDLSQWFWFCIMNPTDTASRACQEARSGEWRVHRLSALEHPNIVAELEGRPAPFPAAVRLAWVNERVKKWCRPVSIEERKLTDLEWPPGSGEYYRPGPLFESRVMGLWPSSSGDSVWSDAVWLLAQTRQLDTHEKTEIGCDVARFGDDFTSIIVRRGAVVLHHETHNGIDTSQTAGILKRLAKQFALPGEDPKKIEVKIDDAGVGGGVVDKAEGFNFIGIGAGTKAVEPEEYPNRRSELWFTVAGRAEQGQIDFSRLSDDSKRLLQSQFMAPKWKLNSAGQRVVEDKEATKKRIGRSPDDADACNLAFAIPPPPSWGTDADFLRTLINR